MPACARGASGTRRARRNYSCSRLRCVRINPRPCTRWRTCPTRGDFGEAKRYLNRLTQVATANAETLWLGVRVERRLGDRNSEASYALQLRNRFPDSQEARALLAGQYE